MPFKKHNPGCSCCYNIPTCDCPNGGTSRKFSGTPTVVVTIEDLPTTISFETLYQTGLISQNFWTTVTVDDLDQYNGTYTWTLNKETGGCLTFNSSNNRSSTLPAHPVSLIRRLRQQFNNCVLVGSPTNVSRDGTVELALNYITSPYQDAFELTFRTGGVHSNGGPGDATLYEITGRQRLICSKNFDPLLDEQPSFMGAGVGSQTFYPKDQDIYLTYNSDSLGRCVSPEARALHEIGKIRIEIIDDVP